MHGALEQTYYNVGKYNFYSFPLNKEVIMKSLKGAGFGEVNFDSLIYKEKIPENVCNSGGEFYVHGKKK